MFTPLASGFLMMNLLCAENFGNKRISGGFYFFYVNKAFSKKNIQKKCVAYPQEDFLFIKLMTSLRISLLNN
jgi:hypothetical protein